jgi:hypothetical protein
MILIVGKHSRRAIAEVVTSNPASEVLSTIPAARRAAGAFSVPARNAAALEHAPIKAILFGDGQF